MMPTTRQAGGGHDADSESQSESRDRLCIDDMQRGKAANHTHQSKRCRLLKTTPHPSHCVQRKRCRRSWSEQPFVRRVSVAAYCAELPGFTILRRQTLVPPTILKPIRFTLIGCSFAWHFSLFTMRGHNLMQVSFPCKAAAIPAFASGSSLAMQCS